MKGPTRRPDHLLRDAFYGDPGRAMPWLTVALGLGVGLVTRSPGIGLAAMLVGDRIWDRFSPRLVIEDPRLGAVKLNCPRRSPVGAKQVWLTFDDGPGPDTPAVLDILEAHGAPATFFFIGENVAAFRHLDTLKARLKAGGHRVGNHSWSHPNFLRLDSRRTLEEISRAQDYLLEVFPDTVLPIFRPPFGYRTEAMFIHLQAAGLVLHGWSVNSLDFLSGPISALLERVRQRTVPGSILLFHDGPRSRARTLQALPGVLSDLRARGYTFAVPQAEASP